MLNFTRKRYRCFNTTYNRRFIHAELDTLHKEYLENNTPFSILLLDLDNFKSVK